MKEKTQGIARLVDLERGYADLGGFGNASLHTLAFHQNQTFIPRVAKQTTGLARNSISRGRRRNERRNQEIHTKMKSTTI